MANQNNAPEPTPTGVTQVDVVALQAELTASRHAHQATLAELDQALEAKGNADKELQEATAFIAGQKATLAEQAATIIALQANPAEFPVFTVGKKSYQVQAKSFKLNGINYTVAELLADTSLQKELVKKGVGFIVAVNED